MVTRSAGDCLARFECLLDQVAVSLDLVDACASRLASLPPGPLSARIPKVLKIPEGHTYAWTEGPLGLNGYYLVSRGGKTPWRLKVRSASFSNVQVLGELLPGHRVADLSPILGSMFFVVGDMDRSAVNCQPVAGGAAGGTGRAQGSRRVRPVRYPAGGRRTCRGPAG